MRPALRLTLAVALVGSSVVACAQEAARPRNAPLVPEQGVASPGTRDEDGGSRIAASSPVPSSSVETPGVMPDAAAPSSHVAARDALSDASTDGSSLQEQLRAAAAASDASLRNEIGGFSANPFGGVSLRSCKRPGGPTGNGHVVMTVAATGEVKSVVIDAGPFPGTPVGDCIVEQFKKARVPPFAGGDVKVGKSFSIN
jgi:hypothetical protein